MTRLIARAAAKSEAQSTGLPEPLDEAPLEYKSALREIMKESGMTLQQLDEVLDRVADLRGNSEDHLRFDEIQELDVLPADRLAHLEGCDYCRELVSCCCDQEYVQQLARVAARSSMSERPLRNRSNVGARIAIGAVALALLIAFPIGKLYSSYESKINLQGLYQKELSSLRVVDTGDDFKAARLYSELNLPEPARVSFFKALRGESVSNDEIVKLQTIALEAENAGWLERTTAKAEVALRNRLGTSQPKSPDDYLKVADLQLTAGKSTAGYTNILKYLDTVDAKPAASKEFTDPPVAMSELGGSSSSLPPQ